MQTRRIASLRQWARGPGFDSAGFCGRLLLGLQCLGAAVVAAALSAAPAAAQLPQVADSRLGVDRLDLTSGERLYGFVLARPASGGATIAVERRWLRETYPDLLETYRAEQLQQAEATRSELLRRLDAWIQERAQAGGFQRYLQLQRERIAALGSEVEESRFLPLEFPAAQIRDVTVQPADRRHIAGIAYQQQISDVVLTPTSILSRRLAEKQVDPAKQRVDLTGDMPQNQRQNERQWAARQALIEYQRLEPLEYQGTGSMLLRKGEEVDAGALLGKMLGAGGGDSLSRLGAELGLPEFRQPRESGDWWQAVTRQAERDGFRGVWITRLEQNLLSPKVTVRGHFFAREDAGQWFLVQSMQAESNAEQQPAEPVERLRQDPQIESLLGTLGALGLGGEEQLEHALRQGAATQTALAAVQTQWTEFVESHTRSVSGPPVPIASTD